MTAAKRMMQKSAMPRQAKIAELLLAQALPGELEGFDQASAKAAARFIAGIGSDYKGNAPVIGVARHTGDARRSVIAIINKDQPFLVDSVAAELAAQGIAILRLLHPVWRQASGGDAALSIIYVEVELVAPEAESALKGGLRAVLLMVRDAVSDWHKLQAAMRVDTAAARNDETAALLHWFGTGQMTMLGHAYFDRGGEISGSLGIARRIGEGLLSRAARKRAFDWLSKSKGAPLVIKSNVISPVHRRVPIELIILPRFDGNHITHLSVHAGLWTSAALSQPPKETPILRQRLANLQDKLGFDPTGHAGKALEHALTALPHDVLVAIDVDSLERLALTAMSVTDRPRPVLVQAHSPLERHLDFFVWLPRDELNTMRRLAIADHLQAACEAPLLNWSTSLDGSGIALIRYSLDIRNGALAPDEAELNVWLEALVRSWLPSVSAAFDPEIALTPALQQIVMAFPHAYRDSDGPEQAAVDALRLSELTEEAAYPARIFAPSKSAENTIHLKLYALKAVELSAAVPVLEHFGFRVLGELPTVLSGGLGFIHDFVLERPGQDVAARLLTNPGPVEAAMSATLSGESENDGFNALMVFAGLDAAAILLFRALFRYLRQTGMSYGMATVVDALRKAPDVANAIVALFDALHNPARGKGRDAAARHADGAILLGLQKVVALDDDRILRLYRIAVQSTLRTNFFAPAAAHALAFKLDSNVMAGLPDPRPWREVFVYSPRVEGIHLRAGPVARGGLRWSDRRDDFRTEVLGLMKAQRVKNAVIVPTGAKGGFYPKMLPDPAQRDAWLEEGTHCYRIFIRTLLSITDNIVSGKVVPPVGVVRRDGDDPYFVVAADKGTATFSDVANAIALEQGFWLGDAFASGGSQGYDHKAMAITAKGGWVSVARHFAEKGVDIQKQPVTVIGCGDMSGDVFGNGMLLSKAIKLVAAFDHRHIFIDPDPDCAKSWAERARLFTMPRSSWVDYSAKLISRGGGIFARTAKSIPLTPQIQALIGSDARELEPNELISRLLKSEVGLIWFGGIGTYVKAKSESNADAGDRANDPLRVNAEDVHAEVIGEGANLGMTQAARIAFSLRGGRCNTDFIDNSAGVDCSDNEVNIKIALNAEMAGGRLKLPARNRLLTSMTDDVATLVLDDNRLQTLALSIAELGGASAIPAYVRLIEHLEGAGVLDRTVEGIAANDELLRRAAEGRGLTRPELAVIMATAKLLLQDALETTALEQDPAALPILMDSFPTAMRKTFRHAICAHQLRKEIIATKLANRMVNRLGLIIPFELAEEEGCPLDDVAEAFLIADGVFDLSSLWAEIEHASMPETTRLTLFEHLALETRAHMADILRNAVASRSNDRAIAAYKPGVDRLAALVGTLLPSEAKRQTSAFRARLLEQGVPANVASRVTRMAELDGAIGLAALATRLKVDVASVTRAFTTLGEAMGLDWAQGTAMRLSPSDPWERLLSSGVARDFHTMRLTFLAQNGARKPEERVANWLQQNIARVSAFRRMIDGAKSTAATPAMLAQIAGQARMLLSRA